jgi:hypothetical protein
VFKLAMERLTADAALCSQFLRPTVE